MRKSLTKKERFEVFKRDSFTCQYCGRKAPDVVLEVDHINPIAKGGTNDIFNLITSCFACNRGKGAKPLNDNIEIEKQMNELEELNERRKQIEMIFEWRNELSNLTDEIVSQVEEYISENHLVSLNEHGINNLTKWVKKYDLDLLLDSIDDSFDQYRDLEKAFNMIPRIAYHKENETPKWKQDLFYIRGIAKNKWSYVNEWKMLDYMEKAYAKGYEIETIKELVFNSKNWTQFREEIEWWVDGDN